MTLQVVVIASGKTIDEVSLTGGSLSYETGQAADLFDSWRNVNPTITDEEIYDLMSEWSNGYLNVTESVVIAASKPEPAPQFHTCRGEDGLPTHKGPCRGSTRSPRKTATPKAKTEKAPKPKAAAKPAKAAKVPAKAKPFHQSIDGLEDLAAVAAASKGAGSERLYGGQSADVQLVTLPDGRQAVHKRASAWGDTSPEGKASVRKQADAEQLASLVAQAVDAPAPKVFRDESDAVWQEYVRNARFDETGELKDTPEAVRIGLLDALVSNPDRNGGNILVDENGKLTAIDHGFAWEDYKRFDKGDELAFYPPRSGRGDPLSHFTQGDRWSANPLTRADVKVIRERLEALRPDFAKLGQREWLDHSLNVLSRLEKYAKGTEPLYA